MVSVDQFFSRRSIPNEGRTIYLMRFVLARVWCDFTNSGTGINFTIDINEEGGQVDLEDLRNIDSVHMGVISADGELISTSLFLKQTNFLFRYVCEDPFDTDDISGMIERRMSLVFIIYFFRNPTLVTETFQVANSETLSAAFYRMSQSMLAMDRKIDLISNSLNTRLTNTIESINVAVKNVENIVTSLRNKDQHE